MKLSNLCSFAVAAVLLKFRVLGPSVSPVGIEIAAVYLIIIIIKKPPCYVNVTWGMPRVLKWLNRRVLKKVLTGRHIKRIQLFSPVGSKIHAPITGGAVPAARTWPLKLIWV